MTTKPLTTPSMAGWTAVTGDAPELQWEGKRGYFPHVLVPRNRSAGPEKHTINFGAWPMPLHDDHAQLIASAPDMVKQLARSWLALEDARRVMFKTGEHGALCTSMAFQASRILQTIASARGMASTDDAAAAIRAAKRAKQL